MTVYVDDARIPATVGRITGRWSHLFADELAELHEFAAAIGLRRAWFQDRPRTWHYDVTDSMRTRAVRAGAQAVSWREAPVIMRERDARPPRAAQPHTAEMVQGSLFPEARVDDVV